MRNRSLTCGKKGPRSLFRVPQVNAPTVTCVVPKQCCRCSPRVVIKVVQSTLPTPHTRIAI
eukprot:4762088-Pyramimonas_sp.AAC.1